MRNSECMGTVWAGEEGINFTVISAGSEPILGVRDGCESGAPALAESGCAWESCLSIWAG